MTNNSKLYQPIIQDKEQQIIKTVEVVPKLELASLDNSKTSTSTMNAINEMLSNIAIVTTATGPGGANHRVEIQPDFNLITTYNSRKHPTKNLARNLSIEKINELILMARSSEQASVDQDSVTRNGFFLHQQGNNNSNFPDSGIGDDEDSSRVYNAFSRQVPASLYIKQVPVVVHHRRSEDLDIGNGGRLSNNSLIAKMTPLEKWGMSHYSNDDGIEGDNDGDDEDEEMSNRNSHVMDEEDDELGRILG